MQIRTTAVKHGRHQSQIDNRPLWYAEPGMKERIDRDQDDDEAEYLK